MSLTLLLYANTFWSTGLETCTYTPHPFSRTSPNPLPSMYVDNTEAGSKKVTSGLWFSSPHVSLSLYTTLILPSFRSEEKT